MRGDRKKAIESFSRALQLDHNCSAAWTLLGHEYVDSCNPKAAVEVYRKAIGNFNCFNQTFTHNFFQISILVIIGLGMDWVKLTISFNFLPIQSIITSERLRYGKWPNL